MKAEELLSQYVTNLDGKVFAIHNLAGMVGAVMARYSRAETGLRETLLREFIKKGQLKVNRATKLIERVLIAYGDDSVGELEGAHLSFESISMLATKVIEHRRIGGSPIEQSTRYVRYDFRDPEQGYAYYRPPELQDSPIGGHYCRQMDRIFENYARMWQMLEPWLTAQKPIGEATYDLGEMGSRLADMVEPKQRAAFEKTYRNDIKTKTCDVLRAFLPLATTANVGLFGNGRFFQHLISKMWTSPLAEANELGTQALTELNKIIPNYVKRARDMRYLRENSAAMDALAGELFAEVPPQADQGIALIGPDYGAMCARMANAPLDPVALQAAMSEAQFCDFLTHLMYSHVRLPYRQLRSLIAKMDRSQHLRIMDAYYGQRVTRRDRPERGLEAGYPYTFDLVTEWAVYKDLMRHRMGTIQVQALGPELGFEMPHEIEAAGCADLAVETRQIAEDLYAYLETHAPGFREYAVLQGHKIRWLLGMNDRALMHMLELRTTPQGHPNYRKTCQEMHVLAKKMYPLRAERMNFVNHEDIYWSRSDSEARQRVKESRLEAGDNN